MARSHSEKRFNIFTIVKYYNTFSTWQSNDDGPGPSNTKSNNYFGKIINAFVQF